MPRLPSKALPLVAALFTLAACGGEPARARREVAMDQSVLTSTNGLSTNGMSTNGMSTNGLSTNGLSTNGLSAAGLAEAGFASWFGRDTAYTSMVMKYVVRCALPEGKSLSYAFGDVTYSWPGELGLAPEWAAGGAITDEEKQLISACLAAHTNKFGVHVSISVRGYYEGGETMIDVGSDEAREYHNDEGCFFGNLFDGTGVFAARSANSPMMTRGTTSLRACAAADGAAGSCPPMMATAQPAQEICTGPDAGVGTYFAYRSCWVNGVSYRALCTRLRDADLAHCGDQVCDPSESSLSSCPSDCR